MPITILTACGTGESSSQSATTTKQLGLTLDPSWGGYSWQIAQGVIQAAFTPLQVPYPARGFNAGSPVSYNDSVTTGVANASSMITNLNGGQFALIGYSQGADVMSQVLMSLQSGDLTDYMPQCVAGVMLGNPRREHGHTWPNDPTGCDGEGIYGSGNLLSDSPDWWWDMTNTYDLAGNIPDDGAGVLITDIWNAAGQVNLISIPQLVNAIQNVAQGGSDFLSTLISGFLSHPISEGADLIEAIAFLGNAVVHANSEGHTSFDTATVGATGLTFVQTAIQYLNSYVQ